MGPRATVRPPNSEKSSRGEFLDPAPSLVQISRKSVTPNATCMVDFLVQPLLNVKGTVNVPFCWKMSRRDPLANRICQAKEMLLNVKRGRSR